MSRIYPYNLAQYLLMANADNALIGKWLVD